MVAAPCRSEIPGAPPMIGFIERWRWPPLLTAAFVVSWIAYDGAGVPFDPSPLFGYSKYIELDLLLGFLFRSVYHLHSQPPLSNRYLGLVLNVFGAGLPTHLGASSL